jgi:hypothetical protein
VSTSLTVTPQTKLLIASLKLSSAYVIAGNSVQGSFQLSGPAPTGGAIVNISSELSRSAAGDGERTSWAELRNLHC